MIEPAPEGDHRQQNLSMAVRRWLLIAAAWSILLLTLASVAQWRVFWQWLIN